MSGVEKSLSLLCFPIIGLLINLTETQVKTAVKFFMYACALGAFYCLVVSVISIIETSSLINVSKISDREYYFFINRELTQAIDLDPLYFSMYINFIAAFFFSNPQHLHFKIDFIVLIFLLIFNVLILSLNGIFVFLLLGICFIIKYLLQKKRPKYLYIIICFTSFCFFLAFCFFKPIKNRLTFSTHYNLEDAHIGKWNTVSLRLAIWENSAEVIAENPWIGVGTGDVGDKLNQKYIEKKFALGKLLSFNAHNQFLQTYLMHGIAGFLVLMLLLLIPLWDAFKQRDALLFSFIVIVGLGFLSESIFERQKGIVFFSLFYTMLYSLHLGKAHLVKK
jgi:O-antigen ligase